MPTTRRARQHRERGPELIDRGDR